MPITVEAPSGVVIDFPDGTDHATIDGVMRQNFGGAAAQSDFMSGAVSGIPGEIAKEFGSALENFKRPMSDEAVTAGSVGGLLNTGKAIAAIPQMALSPLTGAARSLGGRALSAASHLAGTHINPEVASRDNPQQMYEQLAPQVDSAVAAVAPSRGGLPALKSALPAKELAKVPIPNADALKTAGAEGYKAAEGLATDPFHPEMMSALSDSIRQSLEAKGLRENLVPNTFKAVDELAQTAPQNLADVRSVRQVLGQTAQLPNKTERFASNQAIKEIDAFLARNEPGAASVLADANANYSAGKRVEQLTQADEIAGLRTGRAGYGGNEVNVRRQVISPIVEKAVKGNAKGFSADEIEGLRSFTEGSRGVNTLRLLSQMAPSKHGLGWGSPISLVTGGASLAVGAAANKLAALLTRNQFQQIMTNVAKRSPAYTEAVSKATDRYLAAAQDFSSQPNLAKLTGLVSASRALSSGLRFDGVNISSGELLKRLQAPVPSAADEQ